MGEPSTFDVSPLIGRQLGDFVIREPIGRGGYGEVFLATQPLLSREAVVKVLHRRHGTSEAVIERFKREAQLASRLDHPYAAHVYSYGVEPDGLLWIAMELVRGVTLTELIAEQGPLPLARFVPLLERLCEVVHTAHEQGIVHRDLKPSNVMVLSRAGRLLPKLLDLGIAVDLDADAADASDAAAGEAGEAEPATAADVSGVRSTDGGDILGSPHYMAPEQWYAPDRVDRRTDIYALGALSFAALTGRPPFSGSSPAVIARGHAHKPVPALGDAFPPALDEVLARAMAKRQPDRYATVIELAEAFAAASGYRTAESQLPTLNGLVSQVWMVAAPQPLAEAVSALDAARTAHQAIEAVREMVELSAHWAALMALAGWAHAGSGAAPTAAATALIRELPRRGLTAPEWMALARELVRPFADRRDLFPLPELVQYFFPSERGPGGSAPAPARAAAPPPASAAAPQAVSDAAPQPVSDTAPASDIAPTSDTAPARGWGAEDDGAPAATFWAVWTMVSASAADRGAPTPRELLEPTLEALARHMSAISFLHSYPIAVATGGLAERWMGVRRARPAACEIAAEVDDDHALLCDAAGAPVMALHPLVQRHLPVPGGQPELFLFDGPGRRGARLVAYPRGFERSDPDVWTWLRDRVLADIGAADVDGADERAPYRGLSAFTAADADLFFGREREVEVVANRLRAQPFLAVVGPSGAGKSSFVHAGVVPALPAGWRAVTVRPGAEPIATLRGRVSGAELGARIGGAAGGVTGRGELVRPAAIAGAIRRAVEHQGHTLLLIIDQFEELFTLCPDQAEREAYAEILTRLAPSPEAPVRVVITLRDDFLMKAQMLPHLRERLTHSLQLLATPARDDLLRILVEPAERVGYAFEDDRLAAEMAAEVEGHPSALALLSFAASRLWELRDRKLCQLRRVAYEAMGGVGGALAHHADALLEELSHGELGLVREAFRHLVTAEGTRAVLTREEMGELLGDGGRAVIERLIAARLLVASEGDRGGEQLEITHEALIADWPRLARWRREDAESARLRDELRVAARQWHDRGRPDWLLWRGEQLTEYQLWRARFRGATTRAEDEFAGESLRLQARGRRLRRAVAIGAFAVLALALVVALWQEGRAARQRDRAEAGEAEAARRLIDLRLEQARQAFIADEPLHGLLYLREAMARGVDDEAARYLLANGLRALDNQELVLRTDLRLVMQARFARDDRAIITAGIGGPIQVWSADSGALLRAFPGDGAAFDLARGDDLLVAGGVDGSVRVYDLRTREPARELAGSDGPSARILCVAFGPDGERVVAGDARRVARVWSAGTGEQLLRLEGLRGMVNTCRFNADGTRLLTATDRASIWDAATGAHVRDLGQPEGGLEADYSPDGARVITFSRTSPVVRVWDAATGAQVMALDTRAMSVYHAKYSADGERIVTAGFSGAAQVWNAESGALELWVGGHRSSVGWAGLSPEGARLATVSGDRTAALWDVATGDRLGTRTGHLAKARTGAFDATGARLVTGGGDGTARVWSATPDGRLARLAGPGDHVVAAAFSPDGERVLTYSRDRVVRLWRASDHALLATYDADRQPIDLSVLTRMFHFRTVPGFQPAGSLIAVPAGNVVRLLRDPTLEVVGTLHGNDGQVFSAAFTPDGKAVVTAGQDGLARVFSVETGEQLRALAGATRWLWCAAISPDGKLVAAAGMEPVVRVWELDTGRLIATLRGHHDAILAVAFGPRSDRLVTTSPDSTIRIWDVATGDQLVEMESVAPAFGVALSPDGALVAALEGTGRVSMWDAAQGHQLAGLGFLAELGYWISFDPQGERIAVANGAVELWDVSRNRQPLPEVIRRLDAELPYVLENDRVRTRDSADGGEAR